jgi:hypothetical protein
MKDGVIVFCRLDALEYPEQNVDALMSDQFPLSVFGEDQPNWEAGNVSNKSIMDPTM